MRPLSLFGLGFACACVCAGAISYRFSPPSPTGAHVLTGSVEDRKEATAFFHGSTTPAHATGPGWRAHWGQVSGEHGPTVRGDLTAIRQDGTSTTFQGAASNPCVVGCFELYRGAGAAAAPVRGEPDAGADPDVGMAELVDGLTRCARACPPMSWPPPGGTP